MLSQDGWHQKEALVNKRRWFIILAIFFLVQGIRAPLILSFETNSLNPATTLDLNHPEGRLKQLVADAVYFGLFIYELDALKGWTKDAIAKQYPEMFLNSRVRFDIKNIDVVRNGFTRYYPFSAGGKDFIMRIFLKEDNRRQQALPILYEGRIEDPALVFQVLPSLNEILSSCKIKPRCTYSTRQVDSSP